MADSQYCDAEDLSAVGVNHEATDDLSTDVEILTAIKGASDKIDSYLRARFTLPLSSWGYAIRRCASIITAYDLMSGRGYDPEDPGDKQLETRYLQEIAWLEGIAAGTITPTLTDSSPDGQGGGVGSPRMISASQRGYSVRGTGRTRGPFETE